MENKRIKRQNKNSNDYPNFSRENNRQIHTVLRDKDGIIYLPILSGPRNRRHLEKFLCTGITDIPEIGCDETGRRKITSGTSRTIERYSSDTSYDVQTHEAPQFFKYCIHCQIQNLLPIEEFTFNETTTLNIMNNNTKSRSTQPFCKECKRKYVNETGNKKRTRSQFQESSELSRTVKSLFTARKDFKCDEQHIISLTNGKCFNCDTPCSSSGQIDHIMPCSYGYGLHHWGQNTNAILLCTACNQKKKDKFPSVFYSNQKIQQLSMIHPEIPIDVLMSDRVFAFYDDEEVKNNLIMKLHKIRDTGPKRERKIIEMVNGLNKAMKKLTNEDRIRLTEILLAMPEVSCYL